MESALELIDTAGWQNRLADASDWCEPTPTRRVSEVDPSLIEEQAQKLGREQAEQADLLLLCIEAGRPEDAQEQQFLTRRGMPAVVAVATKCDLATPSLDRLATAAVTRAGIQALRTFLAERARAHGQPALAPSLSRCRHHVEACLDYLRQAHEAALFEEPAEVLAMQLRGALDQLGELVGEVYTDDLLDRIFSRFCIGK